MSLFIVWCLMSASWDGMGWDGGGAYHGVVSSFVVWVPHRWQRRGTWFPFMDTGGFCGGGSRFCACGHPFMLVLGHMLLFGQSSSLSGQSDDDERRIRICCSSSGRHVAVSDVAPGMCVSKEKGRDDLLCTVTTLGVVTVGWRCVVGVVGRASWMIVVVEKECCGLLMAPKSSISVCRRSLWA